MKILIQVLFFVFYSFKLLACYEDTIMSPTPFMGNNDEIFKLSDGSIWEVKYEYEYLYEYYPSITACPEQGFIIVDGKKLNAMKISGGASSSNNSGLIETRIDGEFEGFEGDTIFKLLNGQIWQQIDGRYTYHYQYSPEVIIISNGNTGKMSIDGVDEPITVMRIK